MSSGLVFLPRIRLMFQERRSLVNLSRTQVSLAEEAGLLHEETKVGGTA
jgi:hypothetical protein